MESMIINPSKTIRKVQQTYTGGSRLRLSRDMLKKLRTVPMQLIYIDRDLLANYCKIILTDPDWSKYKVMENKK
ncbi:hypothetical protein T09_10547 [Trichinella sp. T9]|nr:hypothetical protein T09_10547 [Trichinella sp. T9]